MPYVICPRCKDPERTLRYEVLSAYEPDTNAGGTPEFVEAECDCDTDRFTAEEWDQADNAALAIPYEDYFHSPADDW